MIYIKAITVAILVATTSASAIVYNPCNRLSRSYLESHLATPDSVPYEQWHQKDGAVYYRRDDNEPVTLTDKDITWSCSPGTLSTAKRNAGPNFIADVEKRQPYNFMAWVCRHAGFVCNDKKRDIAPEPVAELGQSDMVH